MNTKSIILNATHNHSEALANQIKYWNFPGLPPVFDPIKKSELQLACILSEKLFEGLQYEANLLALTEDNWPTVLVAGKVDFLLIEACRISSSGEWFLAQSLNLNLAEVLQNLLRQAKSLKIPTVFWNTQDSLYHDQYSSLVKEFDYVFCCDENEVKLLAGEGVKSHVLLPAVQPRIHNPLRPFQPDMDVTADILYDGWAELFLDKEIEHSLENVADLGLKIVDSNSTLFKNKLKDAPKLLSSILGCVDKMSYFSLLKNSRFYVSYSQSRKSKTKSAWASIEALAFRNVVVNVDAFSRNTPFGHLFTNIESCSSLRDTISSLQQNEIGLENSMQATWREVMEQHTFYCRIQKICAAIGVKFTASPKLKASIISPTNRADKIQCVLDNFNLQDYSEKELVIVFNGERSALESVKKKVEELDRDDISLIFEPEESHAGTCLNDGAFAATGDYCFRFDDDDLYGKYYVADALQMLQCVDADLFGKPPSYLHFEGSSDVYARKMQSHQLTIVPPEKLEEGVVRIGGNSIAGKTEYLRKYIYPEDSFASADSAFLYNVAQYAPKTILLDRCNLVATRREDLSTHTWKITKKNLLKKLF